MSDKRQHGNNNNNNNNIIIIIIIIINVLIKVTLSCIKTIQGH